MDEFDYDYMTVSELKELAKEKGIEGYSKLNKAEIIEILKQVQYGRNPRT